MRNGNNGVFKDEHRTGAHIWRTNQYQDKTKTHDRNINTWFILYVIFTTYDLLDM